ncbi:type IV pilus modification PilV family protein [Pontiella agarivorans]|uniref:Prepilin-type N-terminal cleavage/methylation domain-containing protein n=1 Tax=Pontiella agarivorans TaxID=3038953 RepID=A0ABU5MUR6_9BACT|nr:prepilin-type N-terminal cleavage/methylation domain-containing protein [Pontiella agarivorans]MDZ8117872.1 hypothetical protein [Pontiella agarivorans]
MKKSGFTLMEILLALLVISIGVVSIIGLLVSTLDTNHRTRDDLNTVSFSDLVLNHLHAKNWKALNALPGSFSLLDYDGTAVDIETGRIARFTSFAEGRDGNAAERFTVTYKLDLAQDRNSITAELQVWPGYTAEGNPRIFQTRIYNWRKE